MAAGGDYKQRLDAEPDLLNYGTNGKGGKHYNDDDEYCWDRYPKTSRCCWCLCGTILFVFAIQATFLPKLLNDAVSSGIEDALIFTSPQPNSANYQTWLTNTFGDNAVPIWMECRFFNVTNKEELLKPPSNGENYTYPKLHLTPPLIYDEWYIKYAVNFSYYNSSEWVEYFTWEYYTYHPDSMYPEQIKPSDHIVVISPIIGAMYYEWLWPTNESLMIKYADRELSELLNNVDPDLLFWEGTAEEILFDLTYQFNISRSVNVDIRNHSYNIFNISKTVTEALNQGLLGNGSSPNATDANSTYEVTHTGHDAPHRMGEVLFYGEPEVGWIDCYSPAMQIWPAKDTFFGINNVRPHDQQAIFVNTLYKNIVLNYNYSYTWKDDIELYRYTVQMLPQYLNSSLWPPNAQYNMFGTSGVQNLTSCMGMPIFVSFPEFLGADDFLPNNSKMGLDPNPSWDSLPTVDVEPRTGGIYKANKSLQLNTVIHALPFNRSHRSSNVSMPFEQTQVYLDRTPENREKFGNKSLRWIADDLVVPMVELSECEVLPDGQAKSFSDQVLGTTKWAQRLEWIGVACGCLFAAWATFCGFCIATRGRKNKYHHVQ